MSPMPPADDPWDLLALEPSVDGELWELFHENSKYSPFDPVMSEPAVLARMREMSESFMFDTFSAVELPEPQTTFRLSLAQAITTRVSARELTPGPITLQALATLLHYAYGVSRSNVDSIFPRPFRVVPSAGALYPLELYFTSSEIEDLPSGLYHYNPARNRVEHLQRGTLIGPLSGALVQRELPRQASLIVFITSVFERVTFKYGDRGYRFALLEAGHVAQNLNLVSNALGLGSINVGGFLDPQVDQALGLDGVLHSTVYLIAIGHIAEPT
jgi:SagB-type dehydrogenase family enzyme